MEPLETLRTKRYWMAKRALLDIPIVDGALSPETFTQVVLYTDAQATIAALQARVQELEQWVQDQSTKNLETMRHMDEMQSRAMDAESQLTQRTAELEAAKQHHEQSENAAQLYYRELTRAKNRICEAAGLPPDSGYEPAIKHLQAELERVRGELADERTAYKALSEQHNKLDIEHNDLRTLLLALPKVEGEIEVKGRSINERYPTLSWQIVSTGMDEFTNAIAALLQHRQGMEG